LIGQRHFRGGNGRAGGIRHCPPKATLKGLRPDRQTRHKSANKWNYDSLRHMDIASLPIDFWSLNERYQGAGFKIGRAFNNSSSALSASSGRQQSGEILRRSSPTGGLFHA